MKSASIIVPAHNEERSITRLLDLLTLDRPSGDDVEILVVCNGCTDRTAEVARAHPSPEVRVLELAEPSKYAALKLGDREAVAFPRLYIDADVEIDRKSVTALVAALGDAAPVLAAAPIRSIPRTGVSWPVRWYYDVWEELPQVRDSPFGRGVVALSRAGYDRVRDLPSVMSDDLAMTAALGPEERVVVPQATVVIWPPRTLGDLLRRRIRVATGNAQLDKSGARGESLRTSPRTLLDLARRQPRLAPTVVLFLAVAVAARVASRRRIRRGDYTTWLRDESSRSTAR